uniref:Uncharacterized protein n=1 Tax=Lepeophtheirus salmonis TaxID=72036 RepID=A0A0K2V7R3_LEPSM
MTRNYAKIYRIWLAVEIVLLLLIGIISSVLSLLYYSKHIPLPLAIGSIMQLIIIQGSLIGIRYMAIKTSLRYESKWIYVELTCTGCILIALGCVIILSFGFCFSGQITQGIIMGILALIILSVVATKFLIGYHVAYTLDEKRFNSFNVNIV